MKNSSSVPETYEINKRFCTNEYYSSWLHTSGQLYLALSPFSLAGTILSNKYKTYRYRVYEEAINFLIAYLVNA